MQMPATYNTEVALTTLRLVNKARQCAKRGDGNKVFDYIEQAYFMCINAQQPARPNVTNMAEVLAYNATQGLYTLAKLAQAGKCAAIVNCTSNLSMKLHDLIEAMQDVRDYAHRYY